MPLAVACILWVGLHWWSLRTAWRRPWSSLGALALAALPPVTGILMLAYATVRAPKSMPDLYGQGFVAACSASLVGLYADTLAELWDYGSLRVHKSDD
jgi:hypothetical protein